MNCCRSTAARGLSSYFRGRLATCTFHWRQTHWLLNIQIPKKKHLGKKCLKCEDKRWGKLKPTHSVEWPQQPRKGWCPSTPTQQLSSSRIHGGSRAHECANTKRKGSTKASHQLCDKSAGSGQVYSLRHSKWKQRSLFGAETQQHTFWEWQGEMQSTRGPSLSGKARERAGLRTANFSGKLNYKKAWELLFIKSLKNEVPRLWALLNWVAINPVLLINFFCLKSNQVLYSSPPEILSHFINLQYSKLSSILVYILMLMF